MMNSLKQYYRRQIKKDRNALAIILGLIIIMIVGYIFWNALHEKKINTLTDEEKEKLKLELTDSMQQLIAEKDATQKLLDEQIKKRGIYFFFARLGLVLIAMGFFLYLKYMWYIIYFEKGHVLDNLRNYLTLIILFFTTIAFITKGSLKNFKESIEEMATSWFFKNEEHLRFQINYQESLITRLNTHVNKLEHNEYK